VPARRSAATDNDDPAAAHTRTSGRGRSATNPLAIPLAGWRDILGRTLRQVRDDRVLLVAAGVAFYGILALFPALTALVSIYGLFADPQTAVSHVNTLSGILPEGATSIVSGQMQRIAGQDAGSLNVGFLVGLAAALWSANNGMKALFEATNIANNETETRGFLRLTGVSLLCTLGAIVVLILTLGMIVVVPLVLGFAGLEGLSAAILHYARWPVLFLVLIGGIGLLYRIGPSRAPARGAGYCRAA
jgi:membrane protein